MIRQCDVFPTPFRRDRLERPYIIVVQSDHYPTPARLCAPLVAERFLKPNGRLNPLFEIDGAKCYLHPIELASIPTRVLRAPITNLEQHRDRIIAALDLVFTGV
jgi:toxin CcdB